MRDLGNATPLRCELGKVLIVLAQARECFAKDRPNFSTLENFKKIEALILEIDDELTGEAPA